MSNPAAEMWSVFDARRVKAPELKGLDVFASAAVGWVKNRLPALSRLKRVAKKVEALEPEIQKLTDAQFREAVQELRELARLNRLTGDAFVRAFAIAREGCVRSLGKRPYPVQLMGAMAMSENAVAEMATGEGKTITCALGAAVLAWAGKPVHVITVNDYLVQRDAENMAPLYRQLGLTVGYVVHETESHDRIDHYRRDVVYITSKELVADFLRDQIMMGTIRSSTQSAVALLGNRGIRGRVMVPGLFRVVVDEADSLLVDEAVTPLIISNSPQGDVNADRYRAAFELAGQLTEGRDFKIDHVVRSIDLTLRGQERLDVLAETASHGGGFWKGKRRREELVTQALTALHCFHRDEQYLVDREGKVQIIDEFTGRVMADRSWRHGLHQAIEVKESVTVTADKENLARLSFQRFFRQYPFMSGMTGTAWEANPELWQIYNRTVIRIPTHKPCIRKQLPVRMFSSQDAKYDAVVKRVCELNDKGIPVLVGTRSVWASEDVSKRLTALNRPHRVLNAAQNESEAQIVAEAGAIGKITVATNMAGRGTDIGLGRGVAELGGLHVISTEPHGSARVDRQLFGRAARQGDPGCAQLFACVQDDLFERQAKKLRRFWRILGGKRLIKIAQARAEKLARFNRKQVLRSDDWMDQSLPF